MSPYFFDYAAGYFRSGGDFSFSANDCATMAEEAYTAAVADGLYDNWEERKVELRPILDSIAEAWHESN